MSQWDLLRETEMSIHDEQETLEAAKWRRLGGAVTKAKKGRLLEGVAAFVVEKTIETRWKPQKRTDNQSSPDPRGQKLSIPIKGINP